MINVCKFCNQYNVCRWCITSNESEWVSWTSRNPQHHYQFSRNSSLQQQWAPFLKNWSSTETTGITSLASERIYSPCFARVLRSMMPPTIFKQLFFTGRWLVKMPCSKCFHQRFTAILDPHVWHKIGGWQRVMKLKCSMSLNKNQIHGSGRQLWCSDTNS